MKSHPLCKYLKHNLLPPIQFGPLQTKQLSFLSYKGEENMLRSLHPAFTPRFMVHVAFEDPEFIFKCGCYISYEMFKRGSYEGRSLPFLHPENISEKGYFILFTPFIVCWPKGCC